MSAPRQVGTGALRLFGLSVVYAVGVMSADAMRPSVRLALGAAACGIVAALVTRSPLALLVGVACVGLCLASLRLASLAEASTASLAADGAAVTIEGEVLSDGRTRRDAMRAIVRVHHLTAGDERARVRERIALTIRPAPEEALEAGALIEARARLSPVFFADLDAAGAAAARGLERRGVAARGFTSPEDLTVIGRSTHVMVRVADAGRAAVRRAADHLPERSRGLLLGVTIGDVALLPPDVDVDFRTTGLSHLVAVSGANVAMVLGVLLVALRAVRAGRAVTVAVLLAGVLAFMAITRFEPSVLRAGTMASIALGGLTVGARRGAASALAAAVLILLVHDPFLIYAAGFQLSALATFGIVVLAPRIAERLPQGILGLAVAVTLGAQLAVLPLLALHFHQVSLVSIAANLVVAPAVAPATIIGMLAAAAGLVAEPFAVLARAAQPFIAWMQGTAAALAQVPLASVATPAGMGAAAVVVLALAAMVALARGWRPSRLGPLVLAVALLATGGVWARAIDPPVVLEGLVVEMLDVGQGEAIVVRNGDATMLLDGGPDPDVLVRGLRARGIGAIDLLVVTHPHQDHVAGLVPVVRSMGVARVLDPMIEADLPAYTSIVEAAEQRGIVRDRVHAPMSYPLGDARVDVLWPPADHLTATGSDTNNNSIVLRITYGTDVVLFAGETEEAAQQELLDAGLDLSARVLKVSHHGSARMVPAFYAATGAEVALIPVGPNTFGHPAIPTLVALRGMTILRSDQAGDVAVALDGRGGMRVRTARPVPNDGETSGSVRTAA